ncbi:MAG: hypothetical protein HY476_00390 [Nitrosarchaeum sp.]|nr:hypothetical protein [Nitrosarchaeum sp.]
MKFILFIVFLMLIIPLMVFQTSALELVKTHSISEEGGNPSDGLIQPNLASETTIKSNKNGEIIFRYFVPPSHSCDVKIHIFVDGIKKYTTEWMGNSQKKSNSLPLDSGVITLNAEPNISHTIKFIPEGRNSGLPCTATSYFNSWYGTVEFYDDVYSSNSNNNPISQVPPPASLPQIIQDNWFLITVVATILGIIAAISTIIKNAVKK